jgi:hypothetical protein
MSNDHDEASLQPAPAACARLPRTAVSANIPDMKCNLGEVGRGGWMVFLLLALLGCSDGSNGPSLIHAAACTGTFNACGGDPTGTWKVTAVCTDGDLVAGLNAEIAADYSACGNTFTAASAALGGSVTYGTGEYSFDATMEIVEVFAYTPACFSQISGGVALSAGVCSQLQQGLNSEPGGKATCSYDGTNCSCQGTITYQNTTSGTYTISGSTIVEDSGTTYDYCIDGDTMSQREIIAGNAYGVTQMKKR